MSANTQHHEPLWLLGTSFIRLRVPQRLQIDTVRFLDFVPSPMANEDRLASPLDDNVFAFRDRSERDFDFGEGENVGRRRHA